MKVKVKQVTAAGFSVERTLGAEDIGLKDEDVKLDSDLTVKAFLEKSGDVILAQGTVQVRYSFVCARCLEPIVSSQEQPFFFDYPIGDPNDEIDLGEDIRQEMIMNLPSRVLCQENCLGICQKCGVNLNKETCQCNK